MPAPEAGLFYTARFFGRDLCMQASLDGGSVRFLTLGGVERWRVPATPGAPLAVVYDQLAAEHGAGRLGPGSDRADAVLPDGRLLSRALTDETVAGAFGLAPPPRGGPKGGSDPPAPSARAPSAPGRDPPARPASEGRQP